MKKSKMKKIFTSIIGILPLTTILVSCKNKEEKQEVLEKDLHVPKFCSDYDQEKLKEILDKNTKMVVDRKTNKMEKYIDYDFILDVISTWYLDKNGNSKSDVFYFPVFNNVSEFWQNGFKDNIKLISKFCLSNIKYLKEELNWIKNHHDEALKKYKVRNLHLNAEEKLETVKQEIVSEFENRKNKLDIPTFKKIILPASIFTIKNYENEESQEFLKFSLLKNCVVDFDLTKPKIKDNFDSFLGYEYYNIYFTECENVLINRFGLKDKNNYYFEEETVYFYLQNFDNKKQDINIDEKDFKFYDALQFWNCNLNTLKIISSEKYIDLNNRIEKNFKVKKLIIDKNYNHTMNYEDISGGLIFENIEGVDILIKKLNHNKNYSDWEFWEKLKKLNLLPINFDINLNNTTFVGETLDMQNILNVLIQCKGTLDLSNSKMIKKIKFSEIDRSVEWDLGYEKMIFIKSFETIEGQIYAGRTKYFKFQNNLNLKPENFVLFFKYKNWDQKEPITIEFEEFEDAKDFSMITDSINSGRDRTRIIKINNMKSSILHPIYNIANNKSTFNHSHYLDTLDINTLNFTLAEKSLMGFKKIKCLKDNFDVFKSLNMTKTNHNGKEVWYFNNYADYFNVPVNEYSTMAYDKLNFIFECKDGTYSLKPDETPHFFENNRLTYNIEKIK